MSWEPGTGARSASKERPAAQASPSQQSSLDAIVEQGKAAADPAVRAWGLYHPEVAAFVRKVDRKRVAFVTGLFRDIGFSKVESEARGRMLAVYLMSNPFVFAREPRARRRKMLRLRHRLLTSK